MGSASISAPLRTTWKHRGHSDAINDVKIRVLGSTLLQSIGMFLVLHLGQAGGVDAVVRLGLTYVVTYAAVGLAVLGFHPHWKAFAVFVVPGAALWLVWVVGGGFWAGPLVLGLTAWGFLSSEIDDSLSTSRKVRRALGVLLGVAGGALLLGFAIYIPNPLAYLSVVAPVPLLVLDHYSHRLGRAVLDCSASAVLLALLIALPDYWLSLETSGAGISAFIGLALTWLTTPRDE